MRNTFCGAIARKQPAENLSVVVFFLYLWWLDGKAAFPARKLGGAYLFFGKLFERVNPAVANAVRKLLFLSPANAFGEQLFKRFTQNPLFVSLTRDSRVKCGNDRRVIVRAYFGRVIAYPFSCT